jgi:crotonobetainyl-CoA:carnitine CoA-transferase CaiB-like acyl-CoA transferase
MSPLPLEGIRVIDLTRALSGPYCTTLLADLGADVVKVEPISGDVIRTWGPFHEGHSLYHFSVNRNKRSVQMDLRSPAALEVLRDLVAGSDVLVENFRHGVLDEMGLGSDWSREHAPETIVAHISGFGPDGPLSTFPAFDQIIQGMSGLMSVSGPPGEPTRFGVPIIDILAGLVGAVGVCAALAGRGRGGPPQQIETSLLESALAALTFQAQRFLTAGEVPESTGNDHPVISPYGVFTTASRPLNLAVATDQQFKSLCEVLDREQLALDERFAHPEGRAKNRNLLRKELESSLCLRSADEWLKLLRNAGVPAGPVNDMGAAFSEPQVQALDMTSRVPLGSSGETQVLRGPFRLDGKPVPVTRPAPALGAHTHEVLREWGISELQVRQLVEEGVVACPGKEHGDAS